MRMSRLAAFCTINSSEGSIYAFDNFLNKFIANVNIGRSS